MWKKCTVEDIHRIHINERKFFGIGYHFFIRKDGTVNIGRGIDEVGAHCKGFNDISVGVCFEGDYELEKEMPAEQLQAGRELIKMITDIYNDLEIRTHGNMPNQATLCAGRYFPFDELIRTNVPFSFARELNV